MAPGEALMGVTFFLSLGAVIVLRGPLGRAIADRIAGRAGRPRDDAGLADGLERVIAELEDVRHRLAELEERQDFAERVLAQRRDAGPVLGEGRPAGG